MAHFRWNMPIDPSRLTRFRHRIGSEGSERILKESIRLQGSRAQKNVAIADTTVQEKNITYLTNVKPLRSAKGA